MNAVCLDDRCLVAVTGEDSAAFLQNVMTNDIRRVEAGGMVYAALLTAQGRFLHDFFVLPRAAGGFFLDCETARRDDLLRRLGMYRLRSRVTLAAEEGWRVHAAPAPQGIAHADPRLAELGYRIYAQAEPAAGREAYRDMCIAHGVPPDSGAARVDKDFLSDLNLDLLGAVDWDKGCFIGQELTARMHYRGLAKKRLLVLAGAGLAAGDAVTQEGIAMGEVRAVNRTGTEALAHLKLEALRNPQKPLIISGKGEARARAPAYLLKEI